jgi:hypothetical protein
MLLVYNTVVIVQPFHHVLPQILLSVLCTCYAQSMDTYRSDSCPTPQKLSLLHLKILKVLQILMRFILPAISGYKGKLYQSWPGIYRNSRNNLVFYYIC